MRQEAKIFQLAGNKSLENLLEFLATQMEGHPLPPKFDAVKYGNVPLATGGADNRLDRMEKIVEGLCEKVQALTNTCAQNTSRDSECTFCGRKGHLEERCFKKKQCFACNKVGHIAKFCPGKRDVQGDEKSRRQPNGQWSMLK